MQSGWNNSVISPAVQRDIARSINNTMNSDYNVKYFIKQRAVCSSTNRETWSAVWTSVHDFMT